MYADRLISAEKLPRVFHMYRREPRHQLSFEDFFLPFGGKLSSDNRWIKLAGLIPWDQLEDNYAAQFCKDFGAPAKPFRMALGALIIKAHLSLTDAELVEQIMETSYLMLSRSHPSIVKSKIHARIMQMSLNLFKAALSVIVFAALPSVANASQCVATFTADAP